MDDNSHYKALLLVLAAWDKAEYSKLKDTEHLKRQALYYINEAKALKTDHYCPKCRVYGTHEDWCETLED